MNIIPVNKKGKPFSWSPTAIDDFEGCPYRYAAKRFYCTTKDEPSEASIWGERVHKAFEERIRDGKAFPGGMEAFEPWARVLENAPGEKFFEREFAVNQRLEPCGWFDKNAYGRVKVDLLCVDGKKALVVDYKTGKPKADESQLKIYCWFILKEFPHVEEFNYKYIWLKTGKPTGGILSQYDALGQFINVVERLKIMEEAWRNENFPMNPSGLCRGWCPVEECPHWRAKR